MFACARAGAPVKSFSFYIHYVHFFTTLCVSGGCLVNIAVNIVNIVNIEWPHPQPLPRREGSPCGGTAIEEYWYWREYCLVLSGILFGTIGNAAFSMSQRVGRFVPTGGTICPNGWDNHEVYCSVLPSILFHSSFRGLFRMAPPSLRRRGQGWGSFHLPFRGGLRGAVALFYVHYVHCYVHSATF
jgi:hypothetical protein